MQPAGNSSLAAANATYQALFQEIFAGDYPSVYQMICEEVPTPGSALGIPVTTSMPRMDRWIGDKVFKTFRQYLQTIPVVPYSANVELPRLIVDTDQTGTINSTLRKFLSTQLRAMDKLVVEKLLANAAGYDGVALLADAHPHTNGSGDNLTTDALSHTSVRTMDEQMREFEDEEGEPLGISPNVLLVGVSNMNEALEIAGADKPIYFDASGAEATSSVVGGVVIENVTQGRYKVVVTARITGSQWFLIDSTRGEKAIVNAQHRAFAPVEATDMQSSERFKRDAYQYSLEGDHGFGSGAWQVIGGRISA